MGIFAVSSTPCVDMDTYMAESHNRIVNGHHFFEGGIKKIGFDGYSNLYLVELKPVVPRIYFIGVMYIIGFFIIKGFYLTWWLLPGVLMSLTYVLFSNHFYYFILRQGLKHKKIEIKTKLVSCNTILSYIIKKL